MKFKVTRTSVWEDKSPCKEAIPVTSEFLRDIRTFKNKEEWLSKFPRDAEFDGEPCEFGVLDGRPFRILKRPCTDYVVEINTLDDLLGFIEKNGRIVIGGVGGKSNPAMDGVDYEIEIYDDWRE